MTIFPAVRFVYRGEQYNSFLFIVGLFNLFIALRLREYITIVILKYTALPSCMLYIFESEQRQYESHRTVALLSLFYAVINVCEIFMHMFLSTL